MTGCDLIKIWQKMNVPRFDNIMLETKTVGAKATSEGIDVTFAPAEEGEAGSNASVAPRRRRSTTWCCKRWDARPGAQSMMTAPYADRWEKRGDVPAVTKQQLDMLQLKY
jgi:hypothetical protein